MRIALYCGILAFASQDLMSLGEALTGIGVLFPYVPLLAIPAIQSRSRLLGFRAVLLGPALVLVQTLAGLLFALDSRVNSSIAIFVPGGWNVRDAGGPVQVLMIYLAVYWLLAGAFMHGSYRGTKLLGVGYVARLFGGGFLLEAALAYEIQFTTIGWGEALGVPDSALRDQWIAASTTWLLACGLVTAFVFGVKPTEPASKKVTP